MISAEEGGVIFTQNIFKNDLNHLIIIEKICRFPQDIEWAIMNSKIYILQSRPITG